MKKITQFASILFVLLGFTTNLNAQAETTPCATTNADGSPYGILISSFSTTGGLTNISNSNTSGSVSDYRSQYVEVYEGSESSVNFSITIGNQYYNRIQIHLDSNSDGQFSQSEMLYEQGQTFGVNSGTLTIPATLAAQDYNLRVLCTYNTVYTDPCAFATSFPNSLGDIEDYTLRVTTLPSCGPPQALTAAPTTFQDGSADFSWTAGVSNDSYSWEVFLGTDTTATPVDSGTTTDTSDSTNATLADDTLYTLVLTASCSGSAVDPVSTTFTTNKIITGANIQDFTTYTSGSGAWNATSTGDFNWVANTGGTVSTATGPSAGGTDGATGDTYFYTEASNITTGGNAVLYTPYFDLTTMTNPRLAFDYHMYGADIGTFTTYVMLPDGTEASLVSLTGQQQASSVADWATATASLSSYYTNSRIRFRFEHSYGGSFNGDIAIDDFTIEETPSCSSPSLLIATVSDFDIGTATFSWTAGNSNDLYTWSIYTGTDTTSEAVDTGSTTETTDTPNITLASNQLYTVILVGSCGETTAGTITGSFTTNHLVTGAYTENFGSYTSPTFLAGQMSAAGSWNCPTATGGVDWVSFAGDASVYNTDAPSTGGGTDGGTTDIFLASYANGSSTSGSHDIFTPYFDVSGMTSPRLTLDYFINGLTAGNLTVTMTESDGTETDVITYTGAQQSATSDAWLTANVDLSIYDNVVRFKITATYGGAVAIDDFIIEETPVCAAPTALTISNVTTSSATYSWTADDLNTDYSYSTTDALGNEVASASGTTTGGAVTVDVTGLSPNTQYAVSLTGICGSNTVDPIVSGFTTLCEAITTGFSQNFDDVSALPSCWDVVNGGDSGSWDLFIGSVGTVPVSAMRIVYSATAHDDYLKSPIFTVIDGVTDGLSFQASSPDNSYPEQMDVIVEDLTNGTSTIIADDYLPATTAGGLVLLSSYYDLSAYEGSNVRISFHSTTTDMFVMYVDNFVVGSAATMAAGWAGFTSTSYSNAQNWYAGSVPTGDVTLNLNSDSASNSPTIGSAVSATSLTVDTGVSLTISESGSLQTTGDFVNNGTVTMNSTASAYSSLIVGGSSTGSITYNRYADIDRWYITSSPVSAQDIDTFISNEDLAVSANNSSLVGLADYNNDGSQYAADPTITTGWWDYHQAGDDGTFTSGKGKIVRLASDATDNLLGFTGTINGSVSVPMTVATTAFNLIGNPYPAAVQVTSQGGATNDALSANSSALSEETAWFWNGANGGYTVVNQSPSQAAKITAPGQGFFVSASGSGDFSFTTAMQTTSAGSFNRQTEWSNIDLSMSADSQSSETEIVYFDGATTGWDNGYDSTNWSSGSFQIFTSHVDTSTSQNLAIQSLPLGNFNDMVVPVGVNASAGQMITISVDTTNWPEGVKIYLEDVDNSSYTLLDGQNAEFTTLLDSNESGIGRFYIHTTSNSLGDEDLTLTDVSIYASSRDNLRILGINSGEANVQMFDLMGKQVLNTSFNGQSVNDVKLPNLNTGIYLVNLASDEGTVNKKIIIQ